MKKRIIIAIAITSLIVISFSGCLEIENTVSGVIKEIIEYENDRDVIKIVFENNRSYLVYSDDIKEYNLRVGDDVILKLKYNSEDIYNVKDVWRRKP